MTRRKKRKIKNIFKGITLLSLPFIAALAFDVSSGIGSFIKSIDTIKLKSDSKSSLNIVQSQPVYENQIIEDLEDIYNYDIELSEGYGYIEEFENSEEISEDRTIYNIVSDNPGAKPYPKEEEWTVGGSIVRNSYGHFSGDNYLNLKKGGQVNNKTSVSLATLESESKLLPEFKISETSEPQVLIYHTHTTESFEPYVRENYDANFNYRTTDETKNIVLVGNEIQKQLEAEGIGVIHATDIHDYPSYNGSYDRSAETIKGILEEYPSIKVVLDIHRDAISSEGVAYQPIVNIDGKEAAQIMIISGCDDGTMNMPNYMQNFRLASLFQSQIETDFPTLTRPILFDYRKYNQDLSTGALLIEVGSHGNTLEQVCYSGELLGKSIAKSLKGLK